MRALRVAVLAHVRHPIRPPFEGGMEAHAWHLVRGLAARGHEVTLYASGDSDAALGLVPIVEEHYERRLPWARHRDGEVLRTRLEGVFERAWQAIRAGGHDVVHNNGLHPLPIARARRDGLPMLTSLHVPPFPRLREAVGGGAAPHLRFSVTSERQRTLWDGEAPPTVTHTVCNGIDPADWPFRASGDGSAVWAGRIAPTKGTHLAAAAAHRAGVALSILGTVEDRDYFRERVEPQLHGDVRYLGHVDGARLATLVGEASVLLFTPLWEEPFGLVAIEAMACGLPVAYLDRGAAREVVGEAGVAAEAETAAALAAAIGRALAIPRAVPRRRVERRFTRTRMLEGYERLYRACIAGTAGASGARRPASAGSAAAGRAVRAGGRLARGADAPRPRRGSGRHRRVAARAGFPGVPARMR